MHRLGLPRPVVFALVMAPALAACGGESFIEVEVAGNYQIPAEVDALEITVSAHGVARSNLDLKLTAEHRFPVSVSFRPKSGTPKELLFTVDALLGTTRVASIAANADWAEGAVNVVRLPVLEPIAP